MILDYEVLRFVWWLLVGALLIGFAIADGMDIGVGSLLRIVAKTDIERRVAINTVGPHWDGNQVWLITAGGAIFAAWPPIYAAAFSGFYMAMLLVLFALFFRPVGFDYRSKIDNPTWRNAWDWGLFAGSFIPSVVFGVAFGNLLLGVPFHLDEYLRVYYEGSMLGALLPLLNPFALLTGLISAAMLAIQGALWLQWRTEDPIASRAKRCVFWLSGFVFIAFALAGIWTYVGVEGYRIVKQGALDAASNPLLKEVVRAKGAWFEVYRQYPLTLLAPALGFTGVLIAMLFSKLNRPGIGFIGNSLSMAGIIVTAGVSMFPFILPSSTHPSHSLTVWDATSSHLTLSIMLWAVILFLPIVLAYTFWCYRRMWRTVTTTEISLNSNTAY